MANLKRIKASKRGLTFSLEEEQIAVGSSYRYVIDKEKNQIVIVPVKNGNLKVSKKKVGSKIKPLFDLRSKEVKELVSKASYLEVEVGKEQIIVHTYQKTKFHLLQRKKYDFAEVMCGKKSGSIVIPKSTIQMAVGCEEYSQITLEEYLTSFTKIDSNFSVDTVSKDISQVYKIISLFSGAGMLDYPFKKDPKFEIVYACDYDKWACESYKRNIGEHIVCDSVMNLNGYDMPKADIIIGGPSCKPFASCNRSSNARIEQNLDFDLVDHFIRITQEKNPKIFVIENVPAFISSNCGEFLNRVLTNLSEFEISFQVVQDCELGGYTSRKRTIIIGSKVGRITIPDVKLTTYKNVRQALENVDSTWFNYKDLTIARPETVEKMAYVRPGHNYKDIPSMKDLNRHSDIFRRLE